MTEERKANPARVVYECDVGSTRGRQPRFAWARVEPEPPSEVVGSSDIRALAANLEVDLGRGYSIALGFEAPLFIPVPMCANDLSRGRRGEGNRAFAAPAGAAVTTLDAHQAAWLLRKLFLSRGGACKFTLDPQAWVPTMSRPVLFCWETFVSGASHSISEERAHIQDAATAAVEFLDNECYLASANSVTAEHPFSLIGAAALWSGWTTDVDILYEPALVIKPAEPYQGPIRLI